MIGKGVSSNSPKHTIFASLAEIAQAIGHVHRLELLEQLAQGERSIEIMAERVGLSFANTSRHLQHLRRANLVATRRDGKRIFYRLSDETVVDLLLALGRTGESTTAAIKDVVATYFSARDELEPITRAELTKRLRQGAVTVLDVRPPDEFAEGHLPQAINIPLKDLARRLKQVPKDREVVAYCRGPYCILSFEAVSLLRARGYAVRRLEDGFPEWRASGLPVQRLP